MSPAHCTARVLSSSSTKDVRRHGVGTLPESGGPEQDFRSWIREQLAGTIVSLIGESFGQTNEGKPNEETLQRIWPTRNLVAPPRALPPPPITRLRAFQAFSPACSLPFMTERVTEIIVPDFHRTLHVTHARVLNSILTDRSRTHARTHASWSPPIADPSELRNTHKLHIIIPRTNSHGFSRNTAHPSSAPTPPPPGAVSAVSPRRPRAFRTSSVLSRSGRAD